MPVSVTDAESVISIRSTIILVPLRLTPFKSENEAEINGVVDEMLLMFVGVNPETVGPWVSTTKDHEYTPILPLRSERLTVTEWLPSERGEAGT